MTQDTTTRPGFDTYDGESEGEGTIRAGRAYELTVAGRGGIPTDADAVMLNVTAVGPDDFGFITVYPCGSSRPNASNVNYVPGQVVPNAVLAKVGSSGRVCFYTLATTHLIVDATGYAR